MPAERPRFMPHQAVIGSTEEVCVLDTANGFVIDTGAAHVDEVAAALNALDAEWRERKTPQAQIEEAWARNIAEVARLVRETPLAPDTHTGTRQRWVLECAARRIEGREPEPFVAPPDDEHARVAAARAEAIEECAKVAEKYGCQPDCGPISVHPACSAFRSIAAKIRALPAEPAKAGVRRKDTDVHLELDVEPERGGE